MKLSAACAAVDSAAAVDTAVTDTATAAAAALLTAYVIPTILSSSPSACPYLYSCNMSAIDVGLCTLD